MSSNDCLVAPIRDAERRYVGGVQIDVAQTGIGRVKRVIYPPGFRWSTHMKPVVGTDLCMHAHVGFLARGQIHVDYQDGCTLDLVAPRIVAVEPGHDAWVVGEQSAVFIEFDFEAETVRRLGMPELHSHTATHQTSFKR